MNNNYNFIEQSFVNNLKLIAREVVREELQANGYAVRPDSQFMPNYDPGNTMQDIMSKVATMPNGTNVTGFTKDDVAEPICINTSHDCNTCSVVNTCPIKKAETKEEDKPVSITKEEPKGKKYKDLKEFGLFDLMPNGFNLYLDDDDIVGDEDSLKAQFDYVIDSTGDRYILKSNSNIIITSDELQECTVTYISSDLTDFSVPALWIKPSEEWYKKFEYAKLADKKDDKPYRFSENEVKSLVIDAMSNVKSKRQHRRKSTK